MHICPYCLYCFSEARLLTAHLSDCSVHPEQKVEYPSPDDSKKISKSSKPLQKRSLCHLFSTPTLRPSWYLLKKPKRALPIQRCVNFINRAASSAFASQAPEFNGEIFTYSGENSMNVFFEHIKDQDRYVRSILSDVKPMKILTAEQQLQHAAATTCELCHGQFTKKNEKTKHHCHFSGLYIGPYCNTCRDKFSHTARHYPDSDFGFAKGN